MYRVTRPGPDGALANRATGQSYSLRLSRPRPVSTEPPPRLLRRQSWTQELGVPQIPFTSTATPTAIPCVGDCDNSGQVTIDEILTVVNMALGNADVSTCLRGDANHDNQITVDEILTAVNNALNGCG